jgi:hypothetical protein
LALYLIGGPLANLFLAILSFALSNYANAAATKHTPTNLFFSWMEFTPLGAETHAAFWLSINGFINLWSFLKTSLPTIYKGFPSDGMHVISLVRDNHGTVRNVIVVALIMALQDGIRPRNWDAALVDGMLAQRTGSLDDALANLYGFYYANDSGQMERAGQLLDLAVAQQEGLPTVFHRVSVRLEAAYFIAFHRQDANTSRGWLERAVGGGVEEQTRLRAEAAVLLAEGKILDAVGKAEAGIVAVRSSKDPGGSISERDWLEAILTAAKKGET